TISDKAYHQASHYQALRRNVRDGAWFACVSDATRHDLLTVFPEAEPRAVTIHNMVSHHYFREESPPTRIAEILRTRRYTAATLSTRSSAPAAASVAQVSAAAQASGSVRVSAGRPIEYLLMVSTIEPRKNQLGLLSAWERLRSAGFGHLQLVFVGSPGW